MAVIGVGDGGSGALGSGWIRVVNIQGQGEVVVSDKLFQDPAETILQSCQTSGEDITVAIKASYPQITIDGDPYSLGVSADGGHYEDEIDISFSGGTLTVVLVNPENDSATFDTVDITLVAPAQLTSFVFTGAYPGSQTELKEGDTFDIAWTSDLPIDAIQIQNDDASDSVQLLTFAPATSGTVSMVIGDRGNSPQLLSAHGRPRDASTGALGDVMDTNEGAGNVDGVNVVNLNNLHPSVAIGLIDYPGSQGALKNAESSTVANTVTNYNSILYEDPTLVQLTVTSPTTFQNPKTVTRASGNFNNSTTNFRITATRAANGAITVQNAVVVIAHIAPTIAITLPAARLRSGGNNGTSPQDHLVTITASQPLGIAPTLDPDSGGNCGTFQGGGFVGGPTVWTRSLRVDETVPDDKGVFTFENLVATGLAGVAQTSIGSGASYALGGFVLRSLTFGSFSNTTEIGTSVEDFAKLTAGVFTATNQTALKQTIGTSPSVTNGYTIDALSTNPTELVWLDTPAVNSNSGGTAQITGVEESV